MCYTVNMKLVNKKLISLYCNLTSDLNTIEKIDYTTHVKYHTVSKLLRAHTKPTCVIKPGATWWHPLPVKNLLKGY